MPPEETLTVGDLFGPIDRQRAVLRDTRLQGKGCGVHPPLAPISVGEVQLERRNEPEHGQGRMQHLELGIRDILGVGERDLIPTDLVIDVFLQIGEVMGEDQPTCPIIAVQIPPHLGEGRATGRTVTGSDRDGCPEVLER